MVVVLGPTGRNVAAGMTGGLAYVLEEAPGALDARLNREFVQVLPPPPPPPIHPPTHPPLLKMWVGHRACVWVGHRRRRPKGRDRSDV